MMSGKWQSPFQLWDVCMRLVSTVFLTLASFSRRSHASIRYSNRPRITLLESKPSIEQYTYQVQGMQQHLYCNAMPIYVTFLARKKWYSCKQLSPPMSRTEKRIPIGIKWLLRSVFFSLCFRIRFPGDFANIWALNRLEFRFLFPASPQRTDSKWKMAIFCLVFIQLEYCSMYRLVRNWFSSTMLSILFSVRKGTALVRIPSAGLCYASPLVFMSCVCVPTDSGCKV